MGTKFASPRRQLASISAALLLAATSCVAPPAPRPTAMSLREAHIAPVLESAHAPAPVAEVVEAPSAIEMVEVIEEAPQGRGAWQAPAVERRAFPRRVER